MKAAPSLCCEFLAVEAHSKLAQPTGQRLWSHVARLEVYVEERAPLPCRRFEEASLALQSLVNGVPGNGVRTVI